MVKIHPVTLQLRQDANHILPGIRHRKPEGLKNIRPVDQRVKIQCFRNRINALIVHIRHERPGDKTVCHLPEITKLCHIVERPAARKIKRHERA